MQPPITEEERRKIINYYLNGTRPQSGIALIVGRSEGTVSNVIREFLHMAGRQNIDAIKQLIEAMRGAGIRADDCARGFRMVQILSRMHITLDDEGDPGWILQLESFVKGIYSEARSTGLTEDQLVKYAKQLLEVSKDRSIDPARVAEFCESKQKELEQAGRELEEVDQRKRQAIEDCDATEADLQQFRYVREELRKCGLAIDDDAPKLANMLKNARQLGHNASRIASKISQTESLERQKSALRSMINEEKRKEANLAKECQRLESKARAKAQTLQFYKQLKAMGFGLKELKLLHDTLQELVNANLELKLIASDDGAPGKAAVRKFFGDLQEMYAQHLSFQEKIRELKREIGIHSGVLEDAKKRHAELQGLIDTVEILRNHKQFRDDDIIYLQSIIMKHNVSRHNVQKFAADLDRYGRIEDAIALSTVRLEDLQKQESEFSARIDQLGSDIRELAGKRAAIGASLKDDALHVQAMFSLAEMEGKREISSVVSEARQGMETAKELLEEAKKISQESVFAVSRLNVEVNRQFEALSKLDGFKDLAELVSKISSRDIKELIADKQTIPDIILHTERVLRLIISIYQALGPKGVVVAQPLERIRVSMVAFLVTLPAPDIGDAVKSTGGDR